MSVLGYGKMAERSRDLVVGDIGNFKRSAKSVEARNSTNILCGIAREIFRALDIIVSDGMKGRTGDTAMLNALIFSCLDEYLSTDRPGPGSTSHNLQP